MRVVSEVISWVFMPLLMPIYALLLVMFVPSNQDYFFNVDSLYLIQAESKRALLLMFIIFCVVLPGITFLWLKRSGLINSLEMETQKERTIPIFVMMAYCLGLYFLFVFKEHHDLFPKFIYTLPLSGAVVTFVFLFLNQWKKISIHSGATGILAGFILAYILQHVEYQIWVFCLALVVSGLVMSARLYLEKHSLFESLFAWAVCGIITFGVNFYY